MRQNHQKQHKVAMRIGCALLAFLMLVGIVSVAAPSLQERGYALTEDEYAAEELEATSTEPVDIQENEDADETAEDAQDAEEAETENQDETDASAEADAELFSAGAENVSEEESGEEAADAEEQTVASPEQMAAEGVRTLTAEGEDYTVTAAFGAEAGIPENAELKVEVIDPESEQYQARFEEAQAKLNEEAGIAATAEETETADEQTGTVATVVEPTYNFQLFDISFVVDGEEIEPNDKVNVQINFKAEEFANSSDATIVHFDEEKGAEVLEEQTIDTDEEGNVTAIFESNVFSDYSIIAANNLKEGEYIIFSDGYAINSDGGKTAVTVQGTKVINPPDNVKWTMKKSGNDYIFTSSNGTSWLNRICPTNGYKQDETHEVPNGILVPYDAAVSVNINGQIYQSNTWGTVYVKDNGSGYGCAYNSGTYFQFAMIEKDVGWVTGTGEPVTTADSRSEGITLNLFDYYGGTGNNQNLDYWNNSLDATDTVRNYGINSGSDVELFFYGHGTQGNGINNYTGGDTAMQNIVQRVLEGGEKGFPVLNTNKAGSLKYLFDPQTTTYEGKGRTTYSDVNHLFQKDEDGYFRYDSDKNYAYYNTDSTENPNKDFIIYDGTHSNKRDNRGIGFFPFDDYQIPSATQLKNSNDSIWDVNPTGNGNSTLNHHFGMTMEAKFQIPQSVDENGVPQTDTKGKINGKDMEFHFSGDDDVWVFIDGVLVLDLGGIHGRVEGKINFQSGAVTVNGAVVASSGVQNTQNEPIMNTTLSALFQLAGKTYDDSAYSEHTIKFFYLERGSCYSNCMLEMNLQTYVPAHVRVEKQDATDSSKKTALNGVPFTLYRADKNGTKLSDSAQGTGFPKNATTASGGYATFKKLSEGYYRMEEGTPPSGYLPKDGYWLVYVNKAGEVTFTPSKDVSKSATKDDDGIYTYTVPIENYKQPNLEILKKDDNETIISGITFTLMKSDGTVVRTNVTDEDGIARFEKLDVGTYTLSEGASEDFEAAGPWTVVVTDAGKITITKGDDTEELTKKGNETATFQTTIINTRKKELKIKKEWKDINGGTVTDIPSGVTVNGSLRQVYKGNDKKKVTFKYIKVPGNGSDEVVYTLFVKNGTQLKFKLENYEKNQGVNQGSQKLEADNDYVFTTTAITDDTTITASAKNPYTVTLPDYDYGFELTGTDDNAWDKTFRVTNSASDKNATTIYEDKDGSYEYEIVNVTETDANGNAVGGYVYTTTPATKNVDGEYTVATITNIKVPDLQIYKQGTDLHSTNKPALGGVEFTLTDANGVEVAKQTTGNTDNGTITDGTKKGYATFTGLTAGEYTLTESKAAPGYMSAGPWKVTVGTDGKITIVADDKLTIDSSANSMTTYAVTITNTEAYVLPSAGGPGTYWFTIGGVAILFTALLLWIKPERREAWTEDER